MTSRDDGSHTIFGLKTMVVIAAVAIIGIAVGMSMAGGEGDAPAPFAVTGNDELPAWCAGVFYLGGECLTNPAWHVAATEDDGVGDLFILLNRAALAGDPGMDVTIQDTPGASLHIDLLDADFNDAAVDIFSNIIDGTDEKVTVELDIPLGNYADASIVRLWRGTGEITVYEAAIGIPGGIWVTISGDSFTTRPRDRNSPSHADRMAGTDTPPASVGEEAADGSPGTTQESVRAYGDKRVIYVDGKTGNDFFNGLSKSVVSGTCGPKKTVNAGLSAARNGDVLVIAGGTYSEDVNFCGIDIEVVLAGDVSFH
jgi:hypothetical protein